MRLLIIAAVVAWRLFVAVAAQEPRAGLVLPHDPHAPRAGRAVGNMTWHGGPVQHDQKIFTIFWSPAAAFPAGYQSTINQFVQDLGGTPFYGITSQYSDAAGNISPTVLFGGTWLDTSTPFPGTALGYSDLLAEVYRASAANGWTSDANSYFQIYTPAGITSSERGGLCGLHWFSNPAIGQILFPQTGCFPGGQYPNGLTIDAAINVSSHEIFETVTDPLGNAWFFENVAGEIADMCNFVFGPRASDGSNVFLHGRPYLVQQEWSNAVSGCVMPASLSMTANGSSGALTLRPHNPLEIGMAFNGGGTGFANPSDVYIGVSTPAGVFFVSSAGFTSTVTSLYHGSLPNFGQATLFNLPDVSSLPSGPYVWFMVVNGATGVFFGSVQTSITSH